jgi:hypothetical protein
VGHPSVMAANTAWPRLCHHRDGPLVEEISVPHPGRTFYERTWVEHDHWFRGCGRPRRLGSGLLRSTYCELARKRPPMHSSSGRVLVDGPGSNDTPSGAYAAQAWTRYDEHPHRPPLSG